jgi:glycosyltransferase involved in cell wall biosynthesis
MAALAHGMPIISTCPRVDIAEAVDGETMALVPPDDPEALAIKIREVAASNELRQRLSRGATELSRLFSWGAIAEDTLELYDKILSS